MELFLSPCKILHFPLLSFMSLLSADFSGLLMSLCSAALPSSVLNGSPNFVLSTDLLRAHSDLSSRSLMKTLNSTGPGIDPWGTPLLTNWSSAEICTTDHNSLNPAVQPIFHTPYHPVIHCLSHQSGNLNLEKWKLCKRLGKFKVNNIHCPPLAQH